MIDIIIPVYNAYEYLKRCIDSIEQNTDFGSSHVILIDDASTDSRIRLFLESLNCSRFTTVFNQDNQGFSANVNKGIELSGNNDVILLNSDTIVTNKWAEKLHTCAYGDPSIGIVTPYTNNGTICSIPYYPYGGHIIPDNRSIDEFAAIIERHSPANAMKVSVMAGFCAYIKRSVFNDIGLFDKETFARDYGEDDDFSYRARLAGYQIVLCTNVFIYHSGSVSFGTKSRNQLCRDHERIIQNRYPFHYTENQEFIGLNPYRNLQKNIQFWSAFDNHRKVVMHVVHRGFEKDETENVGGTQFHVKDLKDALSRKYNILVFSKDLTSINIDAYINNRRFRFQFPCSQITDYLEFNNREVEDIFRQSLQAFRVDIVCFHHLKYLSLNLPRISRDLSIPYTVTLHDYYHISPCLRLQNHEGKECKNPHNCDNCLNNLVTFSEYTQTPLQLVRKWRKIGHETLQEATAIYSPSQYVETRFLMAFPDLKNISIIPHGLGCVIPNSDKRITECVIEHTQEQQSTDLVSLTGYAIVDGIPSNELVPYLILYIEGTKIQYEGLVIERLDIEALKNSSEYKASGFSFSVNKVMYSMASCIEIQLRSASDIFSWTKDKSKEREIINSGSKKKCFNVGILGGISPEKGSKTIIKMIEKSRTDIHWYIIGGIGDDELARMRRQNLTFTGWYQRQEAVPFLKMFDIDVICLPSTVPETFCYTLSEAYAAGIPVIASNLGALAERIERDDTGWLVDDFTNPDAFMKCINFALSNPGEYSEKKANIGKLQAYTIENMGDVYSASYDEIMRVSPVIHSNLESEEKFILEGISSVSNMTSSQLSDMRRMLNEIQNSLSYKIISKARRMNIPGKAYIKRWLKALAR